MRRMLALCDAAQTVWPLRLVHIVPASRAVVAGVGRACGSRAATHDRFSLFFCRDDVPGAPPCGSRLARLFFNLSFFDGAFRAPALCCGACTPRTQTSLFFPSFQIRAARAFASWLLTYPIRGKNKETKETNNILFFGRLLLAWCLLGVERRATRAPSIFFFFFLRKRKRKRGDLEPGVGHQRVTEEGRGSAMRTTQP